MPPRPAATSTSTAKLTPSSTATQTPTPRPTATFTPTNIVANLPPGEYIVFIDGDDQLQTLSIDGMLRGKLPDTIQDSRAAISPDQKRIAYAVGRGGRVPWQTKLYIFDIARSETTIVPNGEGCVGPSWTLDGNLVISCMDAGGQQEIYWLSPDGQQKVQLSDCAHSPEGTIMGGSCFPAIISPDGKWIAYDYSVCDPNPDHKPLDGLYLMNADCIKNPSTCKTLSPARLDPLRPCAGGLYALAWSPDGKYLAVVTPYSEQGYGIRIYDVHSRQVRRYLPNPSGNTIGAIAWSPDGKWITYVEDGGIFVISPDGGKPRRVSDALGNPVFWLKVP